MIRTILRVFILIGVLGFVTACGREKSVEVEPQFTNYVESFKKASKENLVIDDLVLKFGDTGSPRARGVCKISEDKAPTVLINQKTWDAISESEREELVFHELGHCVLKRKHKEDTREDGIPESIMYPYSMAPGEYEEHKEYYINELFAQKGN